MGQAFYSPGMPEGMYFTANLAEHEPLLQTWARSLGSELGLRPLFGRGEPLRRAVRDVGSFAGPGLRGLPRLPTIIRGVALGALK
jgi:hypothetical protein